MRITILAFLLIFYSCLVFSQGGKVYHEGNENTENEISSQIDQLEKQKLDLSAANREFITGKGYRDEYYDLYIKALDTGDSTYVIKAYQKLKEANEMFQSSYLKWKVYHTENNLPRNTVHDSEFKDLIRETKDLMSDERIYSFSTTCCGPGIVELHLQAGNVIASNDNSESSFWTTGESEIQHQKIINNDSVIIVIIDQKEIDLNTFKYSFHSNVQLKDYYGYFLMGTSCLSLIPQEWQVRELTEILQKGNTSYELEDCKPFEPGGEVKQLLTSLMDINPETTVGVREYTQNNELSKKVYASYLSEQVQNNNLKFFKFIFIIPAQEGGQYRVTSYYHIENKDISLFAHDENNYVKNQIRRFSNTFQCLEIITTTSSSGRNNFMDELRAEVEKELNILYVKLQSDDRSSEYLKHYTAILTSQISSSSYNIKDKEEFAKTAFYLNLAFVLYRALYEPKEY